MHPMMRCEVPRHLVVGLRDPARLLEAPGRKACGESEHVDQRDVVWIGQGRHDGESVPDPIERFVIFAPGVGHLGTCTPCPRTQLDVPQAIGEVAGLSRRLAGSFRVEVRARDQRPGPRRRIRFGELECLIDPSCDQITVRPALPHRGASRGMEREEAVRVRHGCWVGRALKRAQHRRPEGLAVKLEHVRASDLSPEVSLVGLVRLEGESTVEQREAVVDLETSDRGFGCAPEPHERGRPQLSKL